MKAPLAFIACAFLILVGYLQLPFMTELLSGRALVDWPIAILADAVRFAPAYPAVIALVFVFTRYRLPRKFGIPATCMIASVGLVLTVLAASLAGAGALMSLIHGVTLTLAVCCATMILTKPKQNSSQWRLSLLVLLIPALVTLWSLTALPRIIMSASSFAGGRPFCLAEHSHTAEPIRTFSALRGLTFFTTSSGYKQSSHWYFHGVLVVQDGTQTVVYNWSPRRFRFDRVTAPDRFVVNPNKSCTPVQGFWRSLSLV